MYLDPQINPTLSPLQDMKVLIVLACLVAAASALLTAAEKATLYRELIKENHQEILVSSDADQAAHYAAFVA